MKIHNFTVDPARLDNSGQYSVRVPVARIGTYRVVGLRAFSAAITDATTGSQLVSLEQLAPDGAVLEGFAVRTTDPAVQLGYTPGSSAFPSVSEVELSGDYSAMRYSWGVPMYVRYRNSTDAGLMQPPTVHVMVCAAR